MLRPTAAALAAIALLAPSIAQAHAILISSTPAALAHIPPGATKIQLRYNSRIDATRCKILLARQGADGGTTETRLEAAPGATPDLLTATATLAPGAYTLRWQVLAIDGHVTRGTVPFTVDPK